MNILEILERKVLEIKNQGRYREYLYIERLANLKPRALEYRPDGQVRNINIWCSNDYLAMSHHCEVVKAVIKATINVGLGTGGARSISGTSIYHRELEEEIALLYRKPQALLFNTGFIANAATLSTLGAHIPELIMFSDELNHASIIYGIRHSKSEKKIFRHNDVSHLEELLSSVPIERPKLIVFESLYSMEGDFSPIAEIIQLAEKYNALTYIDEIHAAGIYGNNGSGYAEKRGLLDKIDIIQGGFGKAYGSAGGYIAAPVSVVDMVKSFAPSFVFSTSTPTPVVAGALASVRYNRDNTSQREALFDRVQYLKKELKKIQIPVLSSESHIIPILVGDPYKCKEVSRQLLNEFDIYLQPINAPTVPPGTERLRVTPTAAHTKKDVDFFVSSLEKIWKNLKIGKSL